jgi:phospholipase/carboxylesterase
MRETSIKTAGLDTLVVGEASLARIAVIFLHGYSMRAQELAPFAHALGIADALFVFPQGPVKTDNGGAAWWAIDPGTREADRSRGPRELAGDHPSGRVHARTLVRSLVAETSADDPSRPLVLAGFSQGGMLACDTVLMDGVRIDGLCVMSASRIAADEWTTRAERLRGIRAFVSHGREDPDLAFAAGERLQEFLRDAGAILTWFPFEGGHQIPFPVWRKFRGFIQETINAAESVNHTKLQHGTH